MRNTRNKQDFFVFLFFFIVLIPYKRTSQFMNQLKSNTKRVVFARKTKVKKIRNAKTRWIYPIFFPPKRPRHLLAHLLGKNSRVVLRNSLHASLTCSNRLVELQVHRWFQIKLHFLQLKFKTDLVLSKLKYVCSFSFSVYLLRYSLQAIR